MESIMQLSISPVKSLFLRLKAKHAGEKKAAAKANLMEKSEFNRIFHWKNMEDFDDRRESFVDGVWRNPVSTTDLAKAGLCFTGIEDHVVCFQCRVIITDWALGDDPLTKHTKAFSRCVFASAKCKEKKRKVIAFDAIMTTGSSNTTSELAETESVSRLECFSSEYNRLMTFQNWPPENPINKFDLASAGFYRTDDTADDVKCFACFTDIKDWKKGDQLIPKHRQVSSSCPFLNNHDVGNKPMTIDEKDQAARLSSLQSETDGPKCQTVKYPKYFKEKERLKSFSSWPVDHCLTPEEFVKAGFFFTGKDDLVTCFYCGGRLLGWEPQDDPMGEHARNFPDCLWLKFERSKIRVADAKKQVSEYAEIKSTKDDTKHHQLHEEPAGAEESKQMTDVEVTLKKEVEKLRERNLCKICLDEEVKIIFLPCKHFVVCQSCADRIDTCPICREYIDEKSDVFMS